MQAIAPPVIESRPAASAGAPPEVPQQPAAGTNVSSGDPKLDKLAADYRKQVDGMAAPEEKWAVQHGGERISVVMFNPKNPGQGQGREINASNRDDLKSVMDSLRSEWADRAREDEEYAKALLDKCS